MVKNERLCVPNVHELKQTILKEAHDTMYKDVSGSEGEVLVAWNAA